MTHISESEFMTVVSEFLYHWFTLAAVEVEPTLPSERRPDAVVDPPERQANAGCPFDKVVCYAVEVENEPAATYESIGQAQGYANELRDKRGGFWRPVVIIPKHEDEDPSVPYLTKGVDYIPLSPEWERPAP